MPATPNLGLPYIDAGQAQKHVTHNEALRSLDTLVHLAVLDRDLAEPPESPTEGARWIVKAGASGAWSGHVGHVAAWQDGAWQFSVPVTGWVAYVADEQILVAWGGDSWSAVSAGEGGGGGSDLSELQEVALLGIGTTADEINPLSARLNNVLWAAKTVAEGGDGTLRYIMSKESAAKNLSILLQDNFVGCAEIGLTGDDDFHFKVSPDGTNWLESLKIDRATGRVSFPSGGAREVLTANRIYYVSTSGSDSNDGLSSGAPFATLNKARDAALQVDLNGYSVRIQHASSQTITSGINFGAPPVGGNIILDLGGSTLNVTSGNAVTNSVAGFSLTVQNAVLGTTTSGDCVLSQNSAVIIIGSSITFGTCAGNHMYAQSGGQIVSSAGYSITGGAARHFRAQIYGVINVFAGTVTLTGTPAFGVAFAQSLSSGTIQCFAVFSGGATGSRYNASNLGTILTNNAGVNYFPGSTAGSGTNPGASPYGLYQ